MNRTHDLFSPLALVCGWVAAATAIPGALLIAAVGQGIGSTISGCSWIGLSLPPHRQVWALVNQPTLSFSSTMGASGYWLGSLILPLLVALVLPSLARGFGIPGQLYFVHIAWAAAAIGGAWLSVVDLEDGHLSRWLGALDLPALAVWSGPLLAALVAIVPTMQLLCLLRESRREATRQARLTVVLCNFGLPLLLWAGLMFWLGGKLLIAPALALLAPLLVAMVVAWRGFPRPSPQRPQDIRASSLLWLALSAALMTAVVTAAGRPLGDTVSGLLWGRPGICNNVREWIQPTSLGERNP